MTGISTRTPSRAHTPAILAGTLGLALLAGASDAAPTLAAKPAHTLDQYRDFRALTIDLDGRIPTRDEIASFESPTFDRSAFIEKNLGTNAYAERLTRVYMDLLRLEINNSVNVSPPQTTLRRVEVMGPDGKNVYVYYRRGQRRASVATDGEFCLTKDETGLELVNNQKPKGTPIKVKKEVLDKATVVVRPWWLYRDYLLVTPIQRYGSTWKDPDPGYIPSDRLLKNPDGSDTVEVRVCREEALTSETGTIYASGRKPFAKGDPLPAGRTRPPPNDDGYSKQHKGEPISCRNSSASTTSIDCGCGIGLQYCMPGDADADQPSAFMLPPHSPLGLDEQLPPALQSNSTWTKYWWTAEARHFFAKLFTEDRDFREVLLAKYTMLNGPLAQYYRSTASASCCTKERAFGMLDESEPLLDPVNVPSTLYPHDTTSWLLLPERSQVASGILTMPVFLEKFASRRARASVLYNAFLCKSFVSTNAELPPSTEPNLMVRPGCSNCHATLEPLAAYFSRVEETSAVFLPPKYFPADNPICKLGKNGKAVAGFCDAFYDPAFGTVEHGKLRGAYASLENAEAGPRGIAEMMTGTPEFASCAVERVTASFLGRQISPDDEGLVKRLTTVFTTNGYRMRPLVKAILESDAYEKRDNSNAPPPGEPLADPTKQAPNDDVHGGGAMNGASQ